MHTQSVGYRRAAGRSLLGAAVVVLVLTVLMASAAWGASYPNPPHDFGPVAGGGRPALQRQQRLASLAPGETATISLDGSRPFDPRWAAVRFSLT